MKLATALHLTGMNRATFNTLYRAGKMPFMDRAHLDERWQLDFEHLLALSAYLQLRDAGVAIDLASEAITNAWPDIIEASLPGADEHSYFAGVIKQSDGTWDYLGRWGDEDRPNLWSGGAVVAAATNLVTLARELRVAMGKDQGDHADSDD